MWTTRLPTFAARLGAAVRYHGSTSAAVARSLAQWSPILRQKPPLQGGRLSCNLDSIATFRMQKSSLSTKASQTSFKSTPSLHQSIEEGLLKGSSVNTAVASAATAANAASTATGPSSNAAVAAAAAARALEREQKERNRRYQQAAINGLCSFMVVLLAAQSLKSGTDKRKAELHLEAALEVLQETQDKLKLVLDTSVSQAIAQSCLDEMNSSSSSSNGMHSSKRASSWLWSSLSSRVSVTNAADSSTNNEHDNVLLYRLAAIVQRELQSVVGDTALSATERDQKHMHDLAVVNTTSTSTSTTTTSSTGDATADAIMNETLQAADNEFVTVQQSAAPVSINDSSSAKKRVFSM